MTRRTWRKQSLAMLYFKTYAQVGSIDRRSHRCPTARFTQSVRLGIIRTKAKQRPPWLPSVRSIVQLCLKLIPSHHGRVVVAPDALEPVGDAAERKGAVVERLGGTREGVVKVVCCGQGRRTWRLRKAAIDSVQRQPAEEGARGLRSTYPVSWIILAISPDQPHWWLAPRPRPLSASKNS